MTAPGTRVAVYPGSFDPITRGHEDLIRRARTFADRVIVAVAVNVAKQPLFTLEERVALIRQAVDGASVEVRSFDGLLADFARAAGATVIVRGLRAVSDFEYEFQMALMNRNLAARSEEHTSELQSLAYLVCRLLLEKKKKTSTFPTPTRLFYFDIRSW